MCRALVLASFTILMGATWFRHTDVGDAQLYRTVTRHLLEDGSWLHLRYLKGVGTPFFDHLPFAFWPFAVTWKLFGDAGLIPLCTALSLLTVILAGELARRLAGPWAGLAAMFVLVTTEKYFFQTSYPTLDPVLLPLATGSALVFLTAKRPAVQVLGSAALALLAVAVKGPFGLVPLFGAVLARALVERSVRPLLRGAVAAALALFPTLLFLRLHEEWWNGYVRQQLLASLDGSRTDGRMYHWHAARAVVGRYWPWFPLTLPAALLAFNAPARAVGWLAPDKLTRAVYVRAARLLGIASLAGIFALCLPSRQIWHHTLVIYPLLSAFCALALAPRLTRWLAQDRAQRQLLLGLGLLLVGCVVADVAGLEKVVMDKPCVLGNELAEQVRRIPPGSEVLVTGDNFDLLSCLAAESRLEPALVPTLEGASPGTRWALFPDGPAPAGWIAVGTARGWTLATR